MFQDDDACIQVLMKLGLTLLQATIYLNLTKLEKAGVTRISRIANVARPDVYRVMPALEKRGLVEKMIFVPTIYKATPIKEGLSMLLDQKIEEDAELQKRTNALLQFFPENSTVNSTTDDSQFIITNEKNLLNKKFQCAISGAQIDLNMLCPLKGFSRIFFYNQANFRNALKRNVEIQIILKSTDNEPKLKGIEDLRKNPLLKVKYISDQTPVCLVMADSKEVNIQLSNGFVPSLWSNNPQILKVASAYFEAIWHKDEYLNLFEEKVRDNNSHDIADEAMRVP
jgi:sugar-specific transcriptional regulator TrmB